MYKYCTPLPNAVVRLDLWLNYTNKLKWLLFITERFKNDIKDVIKQSADRFGSTDRPRSCFRKISSEVTLLLKTKDEIKKNCRRFLAKVCRHFREINVYYVSAGKCKQLSLFMRKAQGHKCAWLALASVSSSLIHSWNKHAWLTRLKRYCKDYSLSPCTS